MRPRRSFGCLHRLRRGTSNPGGRSRSAHELSGLAVALLLISATACSAASARVAPTTLRAFIDLPDADHRSHNLSGLVWDDRRHLLYAISDRERLIIPIQFDAAYQRSTFTGGETLIPDVLLWDGEGVAISGDDFIIANEMTSALYQVARDGQVRRELPVPENFRRIHGNRGIESLGVTPDGRHVFFANEQALDGDGPLPDLKTGTPIRINHHDLVTGTTVQHAYVTDPVFAAGKGSTLGVTDLAPLTPLQLLVTERSWVPGIGNRVLLYCANLEGARDVSELPTLDGVPPVPKRMILDLGTLPDRGVGPPPSPQINRLLDNFEGLAVGPRLADGRRVVFVVSDDNSQASQVPRLLVLSLDLSTCGG